MLRSFRLTCLPRLLPFFSALSRARPTAPSMADPGIYKKLQKEIDELKELLSSNESIITALQINTDKRFDDVVSKIPPTNERLLKEVQQMRDDFLALRQNL